MGFRTLSRAITCIAVLACSHATANADQNDLESLTWQVVSETQDIEKLEAFIETFPNGAHVQEARETLEQLRNQQQDYSLEETIFSTVGVVTFDAPMAFGNEHIIGLSLAQIINESPAYPPIEGLPTELWQNQSCKSCHAWTREDLCIQANNYVLMEPSQYREKKHPFDGMLKINLRNWAQNGCE